MKVTTLQKWGNSYALRIPRELVNKLKLREGQELTLRESKSGDSFSVVPSVASDLSLKKLVERITPENRHPEYDWGKPHGKEIW